MYKKIDTTISFYKFINITNLDTIKSKIYRYLDNHNIYGTVIISPEGINVNFCGTSENVEKSRSFISELLNLGSIHYNYSIINDKVFSKLKVKIKDEIIKAGFTVSEDMVSKNKSLEPDAWDKLLDQKPLIIDMRNRFEYLLGTFDNSESLELLNFSDLRKSLKNNQDLDRNRDVAIFCTGGIRCESMGILDNKVAVVTGVGSGIGKAISMAFADEGASLGVGDISEDLLSKTTQDLKNKSSNITSITTDVSSEEEVKKLIDETVNAYGKLDIIVNNVSVAIGGYPITDMSNEDWQKIISINFSSVFYDSFLDPQIN